MNADKRESNMAGIYLPSKTKLVDWAEDYSDSDLAGPRLNIKKVAERLATFLMWTSAVMVVALAAVASPFLECSEESDNNCIFKSDNSVVVSLGGEDTFVRLVIRH